MAFLKFASDAVLGVKGSKKGVREASLDHFADYDDYRTDDGYLYVRVRAISSRVNKNHDGWPSEELEKSYRSFLGKPIFVDHHNHDPARARGVIVDAKLHVEDTAKTAALDPYYATAPDSHKPPTWVELLLEVDAKKFPKLAKAIIDEDIDGVSMGCNVQRSKCSHCGNWARTPDEYCQHIRSKGAHFDTTVNGSKTSARSYEDCYDIGFFEISFVFDPADETALVREIRASVQKEGELLGDDQAPTFDPAMYQVGKNAWQDAYSGQPSGIDGDRTNAAWMAAKQAIDAAGGDPHQAQQISDQLMAEHDTLVDEVALRPGDDGTVGDPPMSGLDPDMQEMLRHHPRHQGSVTKCATCQSDLEDGECVIHGAALVKTACSCGCGEGKCGDPDGCKCGSDCKSCGKKESTVREADTRDLPQSDMTIAPEKVDTLRQEQVCPVCGSTMEDGVCEVCKFEEPPEGFGNPDLTKAQDLDDEQEETGTEAEDAQDQSMQKQQLEQQQQGQQPGGQPPGQSPMPVAASYIQDEVATVTTEKTAADLRGGRINTQEKPLLPVSRQTTDKPRKTKVISDSLKPVESATRKENMSDITKEADGARAHGGPDTQPDARVDVTGVGGVGADAESDVKHVDVTGVGGVDPVEEAKHEEVDSSLAEETGPPTMTWHGDAGDSAGQQAPVTSDKQSTVKKSLEILPDSVKPDAVVDVEAALAEATGPPTETFGGDSFHLTDPITREPFPATEDGVKSVAANVRRHMYAAFKLADAEIELGITDEADKINRLAELEDSSINEIEGRVETLASVKKAGLQKQASTKKVAAASGWMPGLQDRTGGALRQEPSGDVADEQVFI